jgi:Uma2 family endonuclease
LVIEVSDTTGRWDRSVKRPLYAAAGLVETWVVDVTAKVIEVAREPDLDGYRNIRLVAVGDVIAPTAFPDLRIAVAELFA